MPSLRASALLGVLGVVYGDIGTSPLYALKASLDHFNLGNAGVTPQETLGVLSLVFWALVLIVTAKYVALVMRADNNGEGGILALMALAQRGVKGERVRTVLGLIGIAGAGTSALARLLQARGVAVSGCEARMSAGVTALRQLGIPVEIGHSPSHVAGMDAVVFNTALDPHHVEIEAAQDAGIPLLRRAAALAALVRRGPPTAEASPWTSPSPAFPSTTFATAPLTGSPQTEPALPAS